MPVLVPTSLDDAIAAIGAHRGAVLLAGGTDLMVEVNEGHRHLDAAAPVVALSQIPELTTWTYDPAGATLTLGSGVRWTEIERAPLSGWVPALSQAARTVGSPQIRHAGTLGGNLATCSPAGDGLPVLAALDATVNLIGADGRRSMPVGEFMVGVKRTALAPGELVESVTLPIVEGWQGFSKVGVRNAMVIATASACLVAEPALRRVRVAFGSVAPTIVRAPDAERFAARAIDWDAAQLSDADATRFGELAGAATRPIDDHRSTARYRRHAVEVMATRLVRRAVRSLGADTG